MIFSSAFELLSEAESNAVCAFAANVKNNPTNAVVISRVFKDLYPFHYIIGSSMPCKPLTRGGNCVGFS